MPAYVTREEFEAFKREIAAFREETAGEVAGEKAVTRHVLEQARLNGDDLAVMKAQLSHLADNMVLVKAALNSHGGRLNVLSQDVMLLRQDVTQLRRDMEGMHRDMDGMRSGMDGMRSDMEGMRTRFDGMDAKLDAVLAAVRAPAPRDPPMGI